MRLFRQVSAILDSAIDQVRTALSELFLLDIPDLVNSRTSRQLSRVKLIS